MAEHSSIEWTDATWNPITGCSVKSPGCTECYAMRLAGTRLQHHPSRAGLTTPSKAGPVWNGQVRFNEQWLEQPLNWKRPRRIFVCAHGDLFHENVPDAWINRVFEIMMRAPRHTFQVLTKRPERMRQYLGATSKRLLALGPVREIEKVSAWRYGFSGGYYLPNVWLGTSVEDQPRAEERLIHLAQTPAAVRFVSIEPLINAVSLNHVKLTDKLSFDALTGYLRYTGGGFTRGYAEALVECVGKEFEHSFPLDWVIVGGESGPSARDMDPVWAHTLALQCRSAGVPLFMKQMARKAPIPENLQIRQWPGHFKVAA